MELPEAVSLSPITASGEATAKLQPSGVDGRLMVFKEQWPLEDSVSQLTCFLCWLLWAPAPRLPRSRCRPALPEAGALQQSLPAVPFYFFPVPSLFHALPTTSLLRMMHHLLPFQVPLLAVHLLPFFSPHTAAEGTPASLTSPPDSQTCHKWNQGLDFPLRICATSRVPHLPSSLGQNSWGYQQVLSSSNSPHHQILSPLNSKYAPNANTSFHPHPHFLLPLSWHQLFPGLLQQLPNSSHCLHHCFTPISLLRTRHQ